jgi:hypothetical protein
MIVSGVFVKGGVSTDPKIFSAKLWGVISPSSEAARKASLAR